MHKRLCREFFEQVLAGVSTKIIIAPTANPLTHAVEEIARNTCHQLECWQSPEGRWVYGELPAEVNGLLAHT